MLVGAVLRTVAITNATNVDWEDIAQDALISILVILEITLK
jgi:hypothetical protein